MDKLLKPERLDVDPNTRGAAQQWTHWYRTFTNFISSTEISNENKFKLLVNFVGPQIYSYISECSSFENAITTLSALYVKPINEVFARHCLATRRQQPDETIDRYYQALKALSKDCNFAAVTAETYRSEYIRDAFIAGLVSTQIRQRLLESPILKLEDALSKARALESACEQSETFGSSLSTVNAIRSATCNENTQTGVNKTVSVSNSFDATCTTTPSSTLAVTEKKCYYCGYSYHPRPRCPARNEICNKCQIKGHYSKVCKKKGANTASAALTLAAVAPSSLSKAIIEIELNSIRTQALVDTGSSESFIDYDFARRHQLELIPSTARVSMAATALNSTVKGKCVVSVKLKGYTYPKVTLSALPDLCANVVLGHDILALHANVSFKFDGPNETLSVCSVTTARVPPAHLFTHLSKDIKPVATKSRRFSKPDRDYVEAEIRKLKADGIIEESNSPWRAQVVIVSGTHGKRLVVDYSRTINRFTELDAYPLPRIDDLIHEIALYSVFSTIDLRRAYHQIPIPKEDRHFTAFEACNKLWQFKVISFGLTNGVAGFQRSISRLINTEGLSDTFAYLDDVTICGKTQEEHDRNLKRFMDMAQKYNLTLNKDKCIFSARSIRLLGYLIEKGTIRPDPERLQPLLDLPLPTDAASLQRVVGMLAHYAQWIKGFSGKIQPLIHNVTFPLAEDAAKAFRDLKEEIAQSIMSPVVDQLPFIVETDASDLAIGATLSQEGKPVAFSRSLNESERRHSSVEKEAYAITEALKKWRHFLIGRHFTLITDQRSVTFMFHSKFNSKIKNDKILRWRLELSCFKYDIVYRPGSQNTVADTLSRICGSITDTKKLNTIHNSLCHPGITRLYHWVRTKNLPYSLDDIKKMTASCHICAEMKPKFHQPSNHLIKATAPFERLDIDFKGPIPSKTKNHYILMIVDEFSRFPFAFPCTDVSSNTVIKSLRQLFSIFGAPSYVHSDRGTAFLSRELRSFLNSVGVASSFSTPYNPRGNGLVERYNGIIWKTISLALRSSSLGVDQWESVLPDALHAVRSLLCTATNTTPHERFFKHPRRSCFGTGLPTWLSTPGPVLLRSHSRSSKYSPLVEEVRLLESNPQYAHIQFPDGRESTVSLRHLAPRGEFFLDPPSRDNESLTTGNPNQDCEPATVNNGEVSQSTLPAITEVDTGSNSQLSDPAPLPTTVSPTLPRRCRRRPQYLDDYVSS